jgi:hypothetical protein
MQKKIGSPRRLDLTWVALTGLYQNQTLNRLVTLDAHDL